MDARSKAQWIWLPGFEDSDVDVPGRFVLFRKTVELATKPPGPCLIHVSADTRYRLFVNSKSVAFGPCKSYPSRWYYETVDIAEHLTVGTNVITARVLRFFPDQIGSTSLMRANVPGFILWGNVPGIETVPGDSWVCREDRSVRLRPRSEWNYILGPPFLSLDEDVNFAEAPSGWQNTQVDMSLWVPAVPAVAPVKMMPAMEPWKLYSRPIPLLPETPCSFRKALRSEGGVPLQLWDSLLIEQRSVTVPPRTACWVEFETEILSTGFLEFDFASGEGAELEVLYAESYEKDLNVASAPFPLPRSKGDRTDHRTGRLYGSYDRIVLAAAPNSTTPYEPFWFRTFRFLRLTITTKDAPLVVNRIAYRETTYPLKITTQVELPPRVKQMWDICLNTLRNCLHETYEDCPFYEQNQFAMDGRLQMLLTYQLSRDDRLARKTIHEFYASRRDDGLLETNFPVSFRAVNIPQFSLFWILMLHDHMLYFGDMSLVKKYIGTADGILDHFDQLVNEDGLVGAFDADCWAFVDWVKEWHGPKGLRDMAVPPTYKKTGVAAYNSLLCAWVLQQAAELCDFVKRTDTAAEYRQRACALNAAVNRHCFDGELYLDGPGASEVCQHTQIFAIISGAISGKAATDLMDRTLSKSMPQCSYALQHYVFRALEKTGLYEQYFSARIEPWRRMLADNLTTCPEDDVSFRSDCHGWSAGLIYEIVAVLYGIRPSQAGVRRSETSQLSNILNML
jgi:alpha-L-rhamnosidase